MDSDRFYEELPVFSDFRQVTGEASFKPLPADWKVVVVDIEGSTKAIEAGRYKDVNIVGASAIAAAQNAMDKRDFPFVFGGDGATLAIPPASFEKVSAALDGVRDLARGKFRMTLRAGAVEVAELYKEGAKIEVAKFELTAGKTIASFRGGGASAAEHKVKGDYARYALPERPAHDCDLNGLSCRWKPIPSKRGVILSILIAARGKTDSKPTYDKILERLDSVFNGDLFSANPVQLSVMSYQSVWENLKSESRYYHSVLTRAFLDRAIGIIISVLIFKWKAPIANFNVDKYGESLGGHSDFRKFDDILRMVVDCSKEQAAALRAFLEELRLHGEISFGVHESNEALMTCFVYSVEDGKHVHFIDGGNGGYAMAAKQLKAQLKA